MLFVRFFIVCSFVYLFIYTWIWSNIFISQILFCNYYWDMQGRLLEERLMYSKQLILKFHQMVTEMTVKSSSTLWGGVNAKLRCLPPLLIWLQRGWQRTVDTQFNMMDYRTGLDICSKLKTAFSSADAGGAVGPAAERALPILIHWEMQPKTVTVFETPKLIPFNDLVWCCVFVLLTDCVCLRLWWQISFPLGGLIKFILILSLYGTQTVVYQNKTSPRRIRMMSVFSIGIFYLYCLLAFTWQLTALRLGFAFYTDMNWRESRRENVLSFYTRCSIFFSRNLCEVVSLLASLHFCPLDPHGCIKHESSVFSGCANANSNDWLSNSWQTKSIFHLPNKCGKKNHYSSHFSIIFQSVETPFTWQCEWYVLCYRFNYLN